MATAFKGSDIDIKTQCVVNGDNETALKIRLHCKPVHS